MTTKNQGIQKFRYGINNAVNIIPSRNLTHLISQQPVLAEQNMIFRNVQIEQQNQNNFIDQEQGDLDYHDDFCFQCNGTMINENLQMCGFCFRAYHPDCAKFQRNQRFDSDICKYCKIKNQNKCSKCEGQITNYEDQRNNRASMNSDSLPPTFMALQQPELKNHLICTICYCLTHLHCCDVPIQILRLKSYLLNGIQNFVCQTCIRQRVITVKILASERFLSKLQTLFYFVNIRTESPFHCFWISQEELTKKKKNNQIRPLSSNKGESNFTETIENIIDFRAPFSQRQVDYCERIKNLFNFSLNNQNNRSQYGGNSNYRFLVKWRNHNFFVWEDETIVFKFKFVFKKFLTKCIFEQSVLEDRPKPFFDITSQLFTSTQIQDFIQFSISQKKKHGRALSQLFSPQQVSQISPPRNKNGKDFLLRTIKEKSSIQIFQKSSHSNYVELFSQCINELFLGNKRKNFLKPHISIIIAQKPDVDKWLNFLTINCPLLETLVMTENKDISNIKKREFFYKYLFYPQFQVLLINYQTYLKQESYIVGKIKGIRNILSNKNQPPITEIIILDVLRYDFLKYDYVRFPDFHKLFVLKDPKNSHLQSQIYNHFQKKLQVFKFSIENPQQRQCIYEKNEKLQTQKFQEILSRHSYKPENQICKSIKWTLSQRLSFQLYIMAFGANHFKSPDQCLSKIKNQFPSVFGPINSQLRSQCARYIKIFFQIVSDINQKIYPETAHTKDFLFFIQREKIFKRICQLGKMKKKVEEYKHNPESFPFKIPWKLFIGKEIIPVKSWASVQDYILCDLIIKHGFGNWDNIFKDRHSLMSTSYKGKCFETFMLEKIQRKKNEKQLDLRRIVQDRANNCLELMD